MTLPTLRQQLYRTQAWLLMFPSPRSQFMRISPPMPVLMTLCVWRRMRQMSDMMMMLNFLGMFTMEMMRMVTVSGRCQLPALCQFH